MLKTVRCYSLWGLQSFIGEASNECVQHHPGFCFFFFSPFLRHTLHHLLPEDIQMFPFAGNIGLFSIWSTIVLSRALDTHPGLTNTGSRITPESERQPQTCTSASGVERRGARTLPSAEEDPGRSAERPALWPQASQLQRLISCYHRCSLAKQAVATRRVSGSGLNLSFPSHNILRW